MLTILFFIYQYVRLFISLFILLFIGVHIRFIANQGQNAVNLKAKIFCFTQKSKGFVWVLVHQNSRCCQLYVTNKSQASQVELLSCNPTQRIITKTMIKYLIMYNHLSFVMKAYFKLLTVMNTHETVKRKPSCFNSMSRKPHTCIIIYERRIQKTHIYVSSYMKERS